MGIVIGPAQSLDASGNVGGICYSHWRSLIVARGARTGAITPTAKQIVIQGQLRTVTRLWGGTLTAAQRAAWGRFAKHERYQTRLGITYTPNGYGVFVQRNMILKTVGHATINDPPIADSPILIQVFALQDNGGGYASMRLRRFGSTLPGAMCDICEYWIAGPFTSGGRRAIDGQYRQSGVMIPSTIYSLYGLSHPAWYWFRARGVNYTGIKSGWWEKQILMA